MPSGGVHLAVHIGAVWAGAVVQCGSQRVPVLTDGQSHTPSGVFVDPDTGLLYPGAAGFAAAAQRPDCYLQDPLGRLAAASRPDRPHPVDVVAAVLAHLANHAAAQIGAAITALTATVPPGWGPRRRQLLHDAVVGVGLPAARQVTVPAALAAGRATNIRIWDDGSCVLVCHGDSGVTLSLTVLQVSGGELLELATHRLDRDITGLDERLAELVVRRSLADPDIVKRWTHPVTPPDRQAWWQVMTATRHAHAELGHQERAAVLLPQPHPPAVITRDDLIEAAQALTSELPGAVDTVLAAGDVEAKQLRQVLLANDTPLPGLEQALAGATASTVSTTDATAHAIATNALHIAGAQDTHAGTAAAVHLPRTRLRASDLLGPLVIGACSVALFLQTLTTADVNRIAGTINYVRVDLEQFAVASSLIAVATLAAAHLAPTTWLTTATPDSAAEPATGYLIRRAYLAGAAVAITVATLYGLAASTVFGLYDTPYLRWTLTGSIPIVAAGLIVAAIAPRIPATRLAGWLRSARPAVLPPVLATAGIWLIRSALTLTPPVDVIGAPAFVGTIGAACLGVATVLTATNQLMLRALVAPILGLGYAIVYSLPASKIFIIGYIAALAWWALKLTARSTQDTASNLRDAARRLLTSQPHHNDR